MSDAGLLASEQRSSRDNAGPLPAALRGVSLRRITETDEEFLVSVYAETRADEMQLVPWNDEQKDAFVRMQFQAQQIHYLTHCPDADFLVIEYDGKPIGRLYVDRRLDEHRIVDIALLADHRNNGIGTALINEIIDEASRAGKPVRIHVERFNPALWLYERLGFKRVEDRGVYYLMEHSAGSVS